jgi:hypothetical protein
VRGIFDWSGNAVKGHSVEARVDHCGFDINGCESEEDARCWMLDARTSPIPSIHHLASSSLFQGVARVMNDSSLEKIV